MCESQYCFYLFIQRYKPIEQLKEMRKTVGKKTERLWDSGSKHTPEILRQGIFNHDLNRRAWIKTESQDRLFRIKYFRNIVRFHCQSISNIPYLLLRCFVLIFVMWSSLWCLEKINSLFLFLLLHHWHNLFSSLRYQTGVITSTWMAKRWGDGSECWWTSRTVTWGLSWRWKSGFPNCPCTSKFQILNSVR